MMKKLSVITGFVLLLSACGDSYNEQRIKEDSAAINKKAPDSAFNNMNNQNANGGYPDTNSTPFTDSLRK